MWRNPRSLLLPLKNIYPLSYSFLSKICRRFGAEKNYQKEFLFNFKGGQVDLVRDDKTGIAVVTLNNPSRKNALTGKMMVDLNNIVADLEQWHNGRGLILCGANGNFCSGGDINFVNQILTPEKGLIMSTFIQDTLTRFSKLPLISVALIQGTAIGGGAELMTACDFRVMTSSARVGFVQIKMGVATGFGGGTRLVRLLGKTKALALLTSGAVLDATDCKRIGLVDDVFPESSNELDITKSWLQQYCMAGDIFVLQTFKRIVTYAAELSIEESLNKERQLFSKTWGNDVQIAALNQNIKHR